VDMNNAIPILFQYVLITIHTRKQNQAHQYNEIVVFTPAQCLPRYRVKLIQNTPQAAIDDTLCYQMVLDFLGLGPYESVANAFEDAATAGHPGASVRLHWIYSGASKVISADSQALQNYQTLQTSSIEWLKCKANFRGGNDQESQFNLAWSYQHGLGCELNLAKAAQYYWIAAVQGHRDAQYQLGACCAVGVGINPDMHQAITYYELAAAQGHAHAHYVLLQCYELGLGIQENTAKALMHKQAAQKGKHPHLAGIGSPPMSPVIISPNAVLEQEIKQLKLQLTQQESKLKEKEHQFKRQHKHKIDELRQAVSAEKQAKDEIIAKHKQEYHMKDEIIAKKEAELRDKEEALQRQTSTLSSELSQKEGELNVLRTKLSEIEVLKSKMDQVERALGESKEREKHLNRKLTKKHKSINPQSPAPQPQPQIGQFSPIIHPKPSPKPALNTQQQEKQNQLVAACLKGDLALVKQMESQVVSLLFPSQEGLYPLVAAVYGCSLETVRYVELKLKDEARKQWGEVDANKAKENLMRWMPLALSLNPTYGELGNWYVKYNGASWCTFYDRECLKKEGYHYWGGWDGGVQRGEMGK